MINIGSWQKECPVSIDDLCYIQVIHHNFNKEDKLGELIVHKSIAIDMIKIMNELYDINYPIYQMKLISNFNANDWESIEADNTSSFNCRKITGGKKWSNHAYGKAIDINPLENPYISKKGYISHKESIRYKKRIHLNNESFQNKAILLANDKATKIFKKYGFKWGGDWKTIKDYQHFEKHP